MSHQKKHLAASGKHLAAGQGCASSTANPVPLAWTNSPIDKYAPPKNQQSMQAALLELLDIHR